MNADYRVLEVIFLGSGHIASNYADNGKYIDCNGHIVRYKRNDVKLNSEKEKKGDVIVFSGPNSMDTIKDGLNIKDISRNAQEVLKEEIYTLLEELDNSNINKNAKNFREVLEKTLSKRINDKSNNSHNTVQIEISGHSRGGTIANWVLTGLKNEFINDKRVVFSRIDIFDEYAGPINSRSKRYKDDYTKSRSRIINRGIKYINNKIICINNNKKISAKESIISKLKNKIKIKHTSKLKFNKKNLDNRMKHKLNEIEKSLWIISLNPDRPFNNISINTGVKQVILTTASHRGTSVVGQLFKAHQLNEDTSTKLWIHIGKDASFKKIGEDGNDKTILNQIKQLLNNESGNKNSFHSIKSIDDLNKTLRENLLSSLGCNITNTDKLTSTMLENNSNTKAIYKQLSNKKVVEKYKILQNNDTKNLLCCLFSCPGLSRYRGTAILEVINNFINFKKTKYYNNKKL